MKRYYLIAVAALCLMLGGCNDKADIQTAYDFDLSSWYLKKDIKIGEEVEIRFYFERWGDWKDATYEIGYIQIEGEGRVYDTDRKLLVNREVRPLEGLPGLDTTNPTRQVFTLFYRQTGSKRTELQFFVVDNFGTRCEYTVTFTPDTSSDGEEE